MSAGNAVVVISGTNSSVGGGILAGSYGLNCSVTIKEAAQVYDLGGGLGDFDSYGSNSFSIDGPGTYVNVTGGFDVNGRNDQLRISNRARVDAYPNFELAAGYGGLSNVIATVADPGTRLTVSGGYFDPLGRPYPAFIISSASTVIVSNAATVAAACNILIGARNDTADTGNNLMVTGEGSQLLLPNGSIWAGRIPDYWFDTNGSGNQLIIAAGGLVTATNVEIFGGNSASVAGSLFVTNNAHTSLLYIEGSLLINGTVQADSFYWPDSVSFTSGLLTAGNGSVNNGLPFTIGDGTNTASYVMQGGTHSFANGLVISSNSVLSGCGTVTGTVTNYGTILLANGCDIVFSNSVVNFGVIIATNGTPRFLSSLENYGTLIANPPVITLSAPVAVNGQFQFDFAIVSGLANGFTLLQADSLGAPWATNTTAVLTTNLPGSSYHFSLPISETGQLFLVRSP